jgi:hypothetical protein
MENIYDKLKSKLVKDEFLYLYVDSLYYPPEFNYSTNNGHYKTLGDDFYYSKQRKRNRTDALRPDYNNISNYNQTVYKRIYYGKEPKDDYLKISESRPYASYNHFTNKAQAITPDKRIKVNKINKTFYDIDNNNYGKTKTGRSTSNKNNIELYKS